ncbi:hypothetical protein DFH06DRAFT_558672 [Mycena polygramma]|nr:hypothetical protein DFH06DRAFT_558672 [Mycena polygramma]
MRSRGWKPLAPTGKLKPSSSTLPDLLSTSLFALKESADAFPPLKATVGGVLAIWDIAQRAKHSKSGARNIALRTEEILNVIAEAVPDGSMVDSSMLLSIQRFSLLLDEIRCTMEKIMDAGIISRSIHLNRNERKLQEIKAQLDDAYRDFSVASALRVEAQQNQLASQQTRTHMDLGKVAADTNTLSLKLSAVLFYSRLASTSGAPLKF